MNTQVATAKHAPPVGRPESFPRLWDWFEGILPVETTWRDMTARSIKVEEFVRDGRYVVRAELPGVDPDKDVEVTVNDGLLTIRGERREEVKEDQRSEFYYGSFVRTLSLPSGADPEAVDAVYRDGILEVSVLMSDR